MDIPIYEKIVREIEYINCQLFKKLILSLPLFCCWSLQKLSIQCAIIHRYGQNIINYIHPSAFMMIYLTCNMPIVHLFVISFLFKLFLIFLVRPSKSSIYRYGQLYQTYPQFLLHTYIIRLHVQLSFNFI